MEVWTYVITNDCGAAPNFHAPFPTLTVCKPRIRKAARVGELVLAFNGSRLHPEPHSVRWAGIISEIIPLAKYWTDHRFEGKKPGCSEGPPDNFYRPAGQGKFEQVPNPVHSYGSMQTDIGGLNCLVFPDCWYFGATAPLLPESFGLRMTGGRRGERHTSINDAIWYELRKWLDNSLPIQSRESISKKSTGTCARPDRYGVSRMPDRHFIPAKAPTKTRC